MKVGERVFWILLLGVQILVIAAVVLIALLLPPKFSTPSLGNGGAVFANLQLPLDEDLQRKLVSYCTSLDQMLTSQIKARSDADSEARYFVFLAEAYLVTILIMQFVLAFISFRRRSAAILGESRQ